MFMAAASVLVRKERTCTPTVERQHAVASASTKCASATDRSGLGNTWNTEDSYSKCAE